MDDDYHVELSEKFDYQSWFDVMSKEIITKVWSSKIVRYNQKLRWTELISNLSTDNKLTRKLVVDGGDNELFKLFTNGNVNILWSFDSTQTEIIEFYRSLLCIVEICNESDNFKHANSIVVGNLNRIGELIVKLKDSMISTTISNQILSNLVLDFHRSLVSIYADNSVFFEWVMKFIILNDGFRDTKYVETQQFELFNRVENTFTNKMKYVTHMTMTATNKKLFN